MCCKGLGSALRNASKESVSSAGCGPGFGVAVWRGQPADVLRARSHCTGSYRRTGRRSSSRWRRSSPPPPPSLQLADTKPTAGSVEPCVAARRQLQLTRTSLTHAVAADSLVAPASAGVCTCIGGTLQNAGVAEAADSRYGQGTRLHSHMLYLQKAMNCAGPCFCHSGHCCAALNNAASTGHVRMWGRDSRSEARSPQDKYVVLPIFVLLRLQRGQNFVRERESDRDGLGLFVPGSWDGVMPIPNPLKRLQRSALPPVDVPFLHGKRHDHFWRVCGPLRLSCIRFRLARHVVELLLSLTFLPIFLSILIWIGYELPCCADAAREELAAAPFGAATDAQPHADFVNPIASPFAQDAVEHARIVRSSSETPQCVMHALKLQH